MERAGGEMMVERRDVGHIMNLGGPPGVPVDAPATDPRLPVDVPTDAPTDAPTDVPTDVPTDAPTDVAELRDVVRAAAAAGAALRIAGAGAWLDAGRPVRAARRLDLRALSGIVEYVPGDLTMTAGAGTTLAELQSAARAEGQFLPLDPWGDDAGTLGATLATATAGSLSTAFGLPRDVVLGVSVVSGTGELIRAGGRVVKNVAGFDLVRLMIGAWGTLGVITEATVRLRALPEGDETFVIPAPAYDATSLPDWLARLRVAPIHPLAVELLDPGLARLVGLDVRSDGQGALLVRIAGNAEAVAAQLAAVAALGEPVGAPADCWARLRAAAPAAGVVLRLSAAPANLATVWRAARRLVARANAAREATPHRAVAHASVMRGVVRISLPALPDATLLALLGDALPAGLTRRFERLPSALWPLLAPSAVADGLSRGVRQAFDPRAILNPGILGIEQHDTTTDTTRSSASGLRAGTGDGHDSDGLRS